MVTGTMVQGQIASDLEVMVAGYLTRHSVRFTFQSKLIGGFSRQLGDAIVDFVLTDLNILFRVQGTYWHTSVEEKAKDSVQKLRLQSMGWKVVDLYENDLETRFDFVMQAAIQGREIFA